MPDTSPSRALTEFCAAVVNRHNLAWPPTEEQLAQGFLAYFGMARFVSYDSIVTWCAGVGVAVSTMDMPRDLCGLNYRHEHAISIIMPPNGGCLISREHTLFHELRELLGRTFDDLGHPVGDSNTLESRAEQFAANVRIAIVLESFGCFFESAGRVRNPLARACAYGLAGLAVGGAVLGCVYVRPLEAKLDLN